MNKLAQIQTDDSLDSAVAEIAHKVDLSNTETMFLKKKMENEIRSKLAEFASEISNARKQRSGEKAQ
ncbi:MAG: hypothetical protein JKY98_12385 [Gammaproteobacteria bacterium]|nr:hypothetical protein [Gammaproteobacteria bacterium]